MSLSEDILMEFSKEQSWEKGLRYYHDGRVQEVLLDGDTLKAKVSGNSYPFYEVELSIERPRHHFCSCPYDWGGLCKHIIAVGLTWIKSKGEVTRADKKKAEIRERLEELTGKMEREDFLDFLTDLAMHQHEIERKLSNYVEEKGEKKGFNSEESRLRRMEILHQEALSIIEDFNYYGRGGELDEDNFYDCAYEMRMLLQEQEWPDRLRQKIIKDFTSQYLEGSCMLVDAAFDLAREAAETEEDWQMMVDLLEQSDSSYHREKAMKIHLDKLGNTEKFLEYSKQKMTSAEDYYRLVKYYDKVGEIERAADAAQKGIEAGGRGVYENVAYLRNYYAEKGEYERALEFFVREFEQSPGLEKFFEVLDYCHPEDKEETEKRMIEYLNERDSHALLADIYEEKGEYENVLHLVKEKDVAPAEDDEILDEKFPREMIEVYKDEVQRHIDAKKRMSYRVGAETALKIKKIYCQHLDEEEKWESYIQNILDEYPRHPALQEEFKRICLQ